MQAIARNAGFTGSVADFQKKLDADPTQHFRSKEEMLANSRNIAMIIMPELPNQFRRIPALLFGVRPIAPDRESASATNAQAGAPDLFAARFDVRDFNDAVIRDGRLPLDLLTEQIDRFIAASR